MGRSEGHFSHMELPFLGEFFKFYSMFNDGDKAEQGALLLLLGSLGVPSAQVSSVLTIRDSPGAGKCSGKGEEHQHSPGVCN